HFILSILVYCPVVQGCSSLICPLSRPHRGALRNLIGPPQYMLIGMRFYKFCCCVYFVVDQFTVPRPDGHIGNGVFITSNVTCLCQLAIKHIQLTLDLHRVTVDGVFNFFRCVRIKMTEATAEQRPATHLPEQP